MSKYLYLEDRKPYHTSAIYASALHSISLPFRMEPHGPSAQFSCTSGAVTINDLVQILAGQARQNMVSVLDLSMPAPAFSGIIFWVSILPLPRALTSWCSLNIKSHKPGTQFQQSLLNNLQPLTPETTEDVEDMQALEFMTIHGAFASGCICVLLRS